MKQAWRNDLYPKVYFILPQETAEAKGYLIQSSTAGRGDYSGSRDTVISEDATPATREEKTQQVYKENVEKPKG